MKNFIIAIVAAIIISIPTAYAQQYDSLSTNSHYNQYSPSNLSNSYSQYDSLSTNSHYNQNQYSPSNVNSPYSQYDVQYSPKNVSNLSLQQEHDYHAYIASEAAKGKGAKAAKKPPKADPAASFFGDAKPKKNILVFFYLLILSSLALGATTLIFISVFKK